MAKFTAAVPLNIRLPGGFEVSGAAGATHRIPDSLVEEFTRDNVPAIPGGVTWVTQDETTSAAIAADVATALALKYDKTGGTISGAVTVTGALVAQAGTTVKTLNASVIFADQYSSIQAAHDALPAAGGTIIVPAGTYLTSGANPVLSITKSNFRLVGAGRGATIFAWASSVPQYLIAGGDSNLHDITVEGIEFDGSALPTTGTQYVAVNFANTGTRRITVRDLYIRQMPGTAETFAVNFGNVLGGVIDGVYVSNCGGTGIAVSGSTAIVISNCVADACREMGFSISSAETSVKISSDITLTNCISRRNLRYGFNFESTEYLSIAGLVSEGNGQYGVVFSKSAITNIVYTRFAAGSGLVVVDNGTASAGTYAGIIFAGDGTTGANNVYLSGVRAADNKGVKTQSYGATDGAGSSNNSVSGDLRGNLTGEANLVNGSNNQYRPGRFIGASVGLSAAVSLSNASTTLVSWTSETHDDDALHSLVTNKTRLTIPAGLAGKYRVSVSGVFANNATGSRLIRILKSGVEAARAGGAASSAGTDVALTCVWTGDLAAAAYIEVDAYQDSTISLNFGTLSWLMIERV